jgi:hypothetical protein
MVPVLIFIVLPIALIVWSFRIRPLVPRGRGEQTAFNQMISSPANTLFGGHDLQPDPVSVPEEKEPVRLKLDTQAIAIAASALYSRHDDGQNRQTELAFGSEMIPGHPSSAPVVVRP